MEFNYICKTQATTNKDERMTGLLAPKAVREVSWWVPSEDYSTYSERERLGEDNELFENTLAELELGQCTRPHRMNSFPSCGRSVGRNVTYNICMSTKKTTGCVRPKVVRGGFGSPMEPSIPLQEEFSTPPRPRNPLSRDWRFQQTLNFEDDDSNSDISRTSLTSNASNTSGGEEQLLFLE